MENPRLHSLLNAQSRIFTYTREEEHNSSSLCGFPSFCSVDAATRCHNTSLINCGDCTMAYAGLLAAVYVIMGILIVIGNGKILWNVFLKRKGFEDTYSKIRGSLAIADIISGLQLFLVMLSNLIRTVNMTANELNEYQESTEGSRIAVVGGMFYLLGFTSSLYHLVYLSSQRVYAIALPIRYRLRSVHSTYISLAVVWALAITSATFPIWFPEKLTFSYYVTIFLYFPSYVSGVSTLHSPAITTLVLLLIYPYLLMTLLSLGAGSMVFCYYRKKVKNLVAARAGIPVKPSGVCKREMHVLKMVIYMEVGFTITLVPLAVATLLFYSGTLDCSNFSTPYLVCFVLSISNSLVNVLIYCIFDKKFCSSVTDIFGRCSSKELRKKSNETSPSGSCRQNNESSSCQATGTTSLITRSPNGSKIKRIFSIECARK